MNETVPTGCLADGQACLDGLAPLLRLKYVRHVHPRPPVFPEWEYIFGRIVPQSEEHLGEAF